MTIRTSLAIMGCAALGWPQASAMAQSMQPAGNPAEPAAASGVEANAGDILVVARKRTELLSRTPISVTAITGDALRDRGLATLSDIATVTPGVSFREDVGGRAGPSITIRGIGFDDYHALGSPSAAVYINQVYQGSNAWISGQLFDIDHVEILKGPQGTLYGENTTAGAINILTNQPSDATTGFLTASYGSYEALRVEAGLGGTLAPDLTGRIAVLRQSGGGFLTSAGNAAQAGSTPLPGIIPPLPLVGRETGFGDRDFWGARAALRYAPSALSRISAEVSYSRDRGANSQSDVLGRSATGFAEPDSDPYTFYANVLPFIDSTQVGGRLTLQQDIGGYTVTAIAAQQHLKRTYTLDPGSPLRAFDIIYRDRIDQTTFELRLASPQGPAIDWQVGVFHFRDRVDSNQNEDVADLFRTVIDADAHQRRRSTAIFGEANWHVVPKLTATLGLRYNWERASYSGATLDLNPYGATILARAFALPVNFDNRFSDENLSGRAMLNWQPADGATIYVSASRGFKSGGFDGATIFTASKALPFQSERVWAYEAGAKWFPRNRPYNLAFSAFYNDFSNLQATAVVNLGGIPTNVRTNVASAKINGSDLQLGLRPLAGLELTGGIALLHSEIQNVVSANAAEAARRQGKPLPNAPGLSFTLGAHYRQELSGGWALSPGANLSYVGKQFKEIDHYIENDAYALLDARIELSPPGGRWSLALWGRNLTDKVYFVGLVPAVSGGNVIGRQRIVGSPRTIGGEVSWRF